MTLKNRLLEIVKSTKWIAFIIFVSAFLMVLGYFLKNKYIAIGISLIVYLFILVTPVSSSACLILFLMPNPSVFDNSGYKYLFNFSLVAFFLRLIIELWLKRTLFTKKNIIFVALVAAIAIYDFANAFGNNLFSFSYLSNLNVWLTVILAFLLIQCKDLNFNKEYIFYSLFAGLLFSAALGVVYPIQKWRFNWHPKYRFSGLMRDPNYFGVLAILLISSSTIVFKDWRKYFFIAICSAITFITVSKMFILVLALYLLSLIIYTIFIKKENRSNILVNVLLLLSISFSIILLLMVTGVSKDLINKIAQRLGLTPGGSFNIDTITTGRTYLWRTYLTNLFSNFQNVFVGRSMGYLHYYNVVWSVEETVFAAHNTYLDIILSFGFLGTLLYAAIWVLIVREARPLRGNFYTVSTLISLLIMIFALSYLSADCFMIMFIYIYFLSRKNPMKRYEQVEQREIRVLQIVNSLSNANGVTSLLYSYCSKISGIEKGQKVSMDFIIQEEVPDSKTYGLLKKLGCNIYVVPKPTPKSYKKSKQIYSEILVNNTYDVVHCHLPNTAFFYLKIAKKFGVPVRIMHAHATNWGDTFKKAVQNYILANLGMISANYYFACSEAAGSFMYGFKFFQIITNAVDPEQYQFSKTERKAIRKELNVDSDTFVIGNVGRLITPKNQKFLLQVTKYISDQGKNVRLVFVGNGPLLNDLQERATQLGITDKVTFVGTSTKANLFYSAFDVFVLPSKHEGLPVVGVEAQVNGVPVVVSRNITNELDISDNITFVRGYKPEKWSDVILKSERKSEKPKLNNEHFDINYEALYLRDKYVELARKEINDGF